MRWRFYNANDSREVAEHQATLNRIDAWWREFATKTRELEALFSQECQWDLPDWMLQHLSAIHPDLMWEYGPAVKCEGHRLVITPESAQHLRPLTATIIERAPEIAGWEFYAYRMPGDVNDALATVEGRTGGDLTDVMVRVQRGEHHRIDVRFYTPHAKHHEDAQAMNDAFVATETLLGEECLDKWIGVIDIEPSKKKTGLLGMFRSKETKPVGLIPLERLQDTVTSVIESIRDQLASTPHCDWTKDGKWTMWELTPPEMDDYPEQSDLFVAKSPNPSAWSASHSSGLFYSERFTRCGETFCYVKIEGSDGLGDTEFADKAEIEDALDEVLVPSKLGVQIGGGTGQRYSYIDLALIDLERGVDTVRARLQQGNAPKRTWIQFFDADLVGEWIGIYDDTPPPPMDSFDE
ncbi:MAG: hypothetical protein H8E66_28410 [Planctomycetes bacterium]|nr:hypothetical protein [Planctomycetota bacterium]